MKKLTIAIVLVLSLTLVLSVSTAGAQFSSLTSGFQVQNLSSTEDATITMTFYKQDGTVDATVSDTVSAGSSNNYASLTTSQFSDVDAGFNGSVIISSQVEVAAIVNVLGDGGAFGGASYISFDGGSTTASIPLVAKNFFNINTFFYVQNTGSNPANVTVTYQPGGSTETATIPVGASAVFNQATNGSLSDGFLGAATVQSTNNEPIVAAVIQYDNDSLLAYNGFTGGSQNPVMPLVVNNIFSTDTGIQIQNTGTSATDVTVTYTPISPGGTCTETKTIQPGASENYGLGYLTSTPACDGASGYIGSAAVTGNSASQPLVGLVNQATIGGANASAYSAFDPASGSATVNIPLIIQDLKFTGLANIFTGFNIVNVGTSATTVTCTFSGQSTSANVSGSLNPGQALNAVQTGGSTGIPAGTVTSATCTASGGDQKIIGVVNQIGGLGDLNLTYEAFNQ